MQLNFIASITVLLALYSHSAFSETIAGASYKDVCKKFEQEGVTTRTQSGGNAGMSQRMWLSSLVPGVAIRDDVTPQLRTRT